MPIKFSELTQKNISDSSYIAGLYIDTTSETNQANCKIPTSQFAKQSDLESSYVNITGNQAISGEKSFTSSITKQSLVIDSGATPQTNQYNQINFKDKNGIRMGSVESALYTNGSYVTLLNCQKVVSGETVYSQLAVGIDSNGIQFATAPTPQANDNSSKIATTAWARSYLSTFLSLLFPVGSLYFGTQSSCPLTTLIPGSTWNLVGTGRALWGGNGGNGNSTIAAGLPNITGDVGCVQAEFSTWNGAFYNPGGSGKGISSGGGGNLNFAFDASRCSAIYGRSSTVQPPAYVSNIWRRSA